jgi:hypothetical protein
LGIHADCLTGAASPQLVQGIGLGESHADVAVRGHLVVGAVLFMLATLVNNAISVGVVFPNGARFSRQDEVALVFPVSCAGLATPCRAVV